MRVGAAGFAAGAALGRELVSQQAAQLGGALPLAPGPGGDDVPGGPCFELIWAQVAGAVLAGCAVELISSTVLVGFAGWTRRGYKGGSSRADSRPARASRQGAFCCASR